MRTTKGRGTLLSLAIVLAVLLGLPGLSAVAQDTPTPGGTLTIAFVPLTTDIDVNARNVSTLNEQAQYFYETLFDRNGERRRSSRCWSRTSRSPRTASSTPGPCNRT